MLVLKDVLRPRLKPSSSGGGRVPTRQVPYRQNQVYIRVVHFSVMLCFQASNFYYRVLITTLYHLHQLLASEISKVGTRVLWVLAMFRTKIYFSNYFPQTDNSSLDKS